MPLISSERMPLSRAGSLLLAQITTPTSDTVSALRVNIMPEPAVMDVGKEQSEKHQPAESQPEITTHPADYHISRLEEQDPTKANEARKPFPKNSWLELTPQKSWLEAYSQRPAGSEENFTLSHHRKHHKNHHRKHHRNHHSDSGHHADQRSRHRAGDQSKNSLSMLEVALDWVYGSAESAEGTSRSTKRTENVNSNIQNDISGNSDKGMHSDIENSNIQNDIENANSDIQNQGMQNKNGKSDQSQMSNSSVDQDQSHASFVDQSQTNLSQDENQSDSPYANGEKEFDAPEVSKSSYQNSRVSMLSKHRDPHHSFLQEDSNSEASLIDQAESPSESSTEGNPTDNNSIGSVQRNYKKSNKENRSSMLQAFGAGRKQGKSGYGGSRKIGKGDKAGKSSDGGRRPYQKGGRGMDRGISEFESGFGSDSKGKSGFGSKGKDGRGRSQDKSKNRMKDKSKDGKKGKSKGGMKGKSKGGMKGKSKEKTRESYGGKGGFDKGSFGGNYAAGKGSGKGRDGGLGRKASKSRNGKGGKGKGRVSDNVLNADNGQYFDGLDGYGTYSTSSQEQKDLAEATQEAAASAEKSAKAADKAAQACEESVEDNRKIADQIQTAWNDARRKDSAASSGGIVRASPSYASSSYASPSDGSSSYRDENGFLCTWVGDVAILWDESDTEYHDGNGYWCEDDDDDDESPEEDGYWDTSMGREPYYCSFVGIDEEQRLNQKGFVDEYGDGNGYWCMREEDDDAINVGPGDESQWAESPAPGVPPIVGDQWDGLTGADQWNELTGADQWGELTGADQWGELTGADQWDELTGADQWGDADAGEWYAAQDWPGQPYAGPFASDPYPYDSPTVPWDVAQDGFYAYDGMQRGTEGWSDMYGYQGW